MEIVNDFTNRFFLSSSPVGNSGAFSLM